MSLLAQSIAAHGGLERWRSVPSVKVSVDAGGLAFASRGQRTAFRGVTATVHTATQRVVFDDFTAPGLRGVWSRGEATIEHDGEVVARAERCSKGPRWSPVDALSFGGAALWTYVAFPFVLYDAGFEVEELEGRRLRVRLRPPLVAHAREHVLHLDDRGRIRRQDYTAEAFGRWARAANVVLEHREVDGILLGIRRRVTPRALGRPLPGPALVGISLSSPAGPTAERQTGS